MFLPAGCASGLRNSKSKSQKAGLGLQIGDHEMRIANLDSEKRHGLCLLFVLVAIVASRAGTADACCGAGETEGQPAGRSATYVWISPGTFQMGCSPNDSECNQAEDRRTRGPLRTFRSARRR